MTKEAIIKVENLSKVFKLPHEKLSTVKQHFLSIFNKKGYEQFKALDSVSFEIKKGEFFGIIGANGSGKSTLLKILAQIYQPTSGKVTINGSLSPFIELGVGFNPELTARDNIFLNAAILGLTRKQTEEKFDEIVAFSELENFLDQKLKNFSSGMQVRLAFAIAIQAHADILLIDEVLAVGDASFQEKCLVLFRALKKEGKTIIFVSHALGVIEEFCDRCLLINKGKVSFLGESEEAIYKYMLSNAKEERSNAKEDSAPLNNNKATISSVKIVDNKGEERSVFKFGEEIKIELNISNKLKKSELNFGIALFSGSANYCYGTNTLIDDFHLKGSDKITLTYTKPKILPGDYNFVAAIFGKSDKDVIDFKQKAGNFKIIGSIKDQGVALLEHKWSYE